MARGPRLMAWLVARRELPPSLFSFLHGRTWSAPCFISFLTLLVSSPPRRSIPSLLIQTRAQHLGDTLAFFSSGFERLPRERHSSSQSVKSSGGVFLARILEFLVFLVEWCGAVEWLVMDLAVD